MKTKHDKNMPVQAQMCATCPFREGSKYECLRTDITMSAITEANRICHSTGRNALMRNSKPERFCRGARNVQLRFFHGLGLLKSATDEAWAAKRKEIGI